MNTLRPSLTLAAFSVVLLLVVSSPAQTNKYGWTFSGTPAGGPFPNYFNTNAAFNVTTSGTAIVSADTPVFSPVHGQTNSVDLDIGTQGSLTFSKNILSNTMSQFTASVWLNLAKQDANDRILARNEAGSSAGSITLDFFAANEYRMRFRIGDGTSLVTLGTATTGGSATSNSWHMFTVVYDGTQSITNNRLKMYVDTNSVTISYTTLPSAIPAYAGAPNWELSPSKTLDGKATQLFLSDFALTRGEISSLYTMGLVAIPEPGTAALVAGVGLAGLALFRRKRGG